MTAIATPSIEPAARLVALGRSTLDGQPVDGLLAIGAQGDTVEGYCAVSTDLLVGASVVCLAGAPRDTSLLLFREH